MSAATDASASGWERAAPTLVGGIRWTSQHVREFVRRHRRGRGALVVVLIGCAALWIADYNSLEQRAQRRVSAIGGWTAGPRRLDRISGGARNNAVTRLIARLPSRKVVRGLVLEGKQPTDDDLELFVTAFPHIEQLDVSSSPITDVSLQHISHLPKLWVLKARHTRVTDDGVVHLAGCSQLSIVELDGTQITDAAIAELAQLPRLGRISVSGTTVTDAGLAEFQGRSLLWINVSGTQVTDSGAAAFLEANPGCIVVR